jgi:hypothetical protein
MSFQQFREFLDEKKKLVTNPPTEKIPDFKGKIPKSPQGGKPYSNAQAAVKPKGPEKGLGDEGDDSLKYNPKIDQKDKELTAWTSIKELAEKYNTGINSDSLGAIQKVAKLAENANCVATIVLEFKRNGTLPLLLKQMLTVSETYDCFVELLNSQYGEEISERLASAMDTCLSEMVAPPIHKDEDELSDEDLDDSDSSQIPQIDGGEDTDEEEPSDEGEEEEEGDEEEGDEESPFDGEGEDPNSPDHPDHPDNTKKTLGLLDDEEESPKHLAHHHLTKAMARNPRMAHDMRSML